MEHILKLQPKYFDYINNGTKRIELRLYDEKRQKIAIGDTIIFQKEPEIKIGAALQIFLEKENVPLLPSHQENLYLYLLFIGKPPA